ncbi:uncharacterized protein PRCAT00006032001 [Priceomyces carsonii]|uniref:uncharacterized protein n=1 Tax=Priceomyces carsonii TaxID=28549 RepID=UPI002EDAF7AF|nr:unnamed protein product [Priceomyces carsonii]
MMHSNQQMPNGGYRTVSTTSNLSLNSSTTSITRVALGPIQMLNLNKQSSAKDHLHFQCLELKQRLSSIEGMAPFMRLAYVAAEQCAEQQALVLSQQLQQDKGISDFRASVGSTGFSIHSDSSSLNSSVTRPSNNSIFTFTAGVLPANISVDPVTLLWKLFQQGAPLCLVFNSVVSGHQIPIIGSDDMRVCKKSVYDFLIAVKTHLEFDDESMITISNVFLESTHDLIKVIAVIKKIIDLKPSLVLSATEVEKLNMADLSISDDRSKVFNEIITTERKYVQDLELMLKYKSELQNAELISNEQVHILFPNLNEIVDFQRRFLNGLESNINIPTKYQRIGSTFLHASSGPFKAYEPWTVGQLGAIDLINKEANNLRKSSNLLDPGFELQSYIIKPIQRLCKYPLLLKELIKASPEFNDESFTPTLSQNELLLAETAMKEVANQVNEAQRRAENLGYAQSLLERVSNWRGFNLKDQGELLHHGVVGVRDVDSEKDYVAYLFERIIFFFIEANKDTGKEKEKKKREILSSRKKSSSVASASTANLLESLGKAKDKSQLELKGRVYILEIYNVSSSNQNGYMLIISWSGKKESGSFTLRYRTEETRNQWENSLRQQKSSEMSSQINKKVRDSQGSQLTNDSGIYDMAAAYANPSPVSTTNGAGIIDNNSIRSSNGSSYHRHHSSSSTFSMMRNSKSKSSTEPSRMSSTGLNVISSSSDSSFQTNVEIKLLYNRLEIPDVLVVPSAIHFTDLHLKISSKIAASNRVNDDIMVNKLKYKDEDGDFVVMDSHDDWILAIDMLEEYVKDTRANRRSLTIWVS